MILYDIIIVLPGRIYWLSMGTLRDLDKTKLFVGVHRHLVGTRSFPRRVVIGLIVPAWDTKQAQVLPGNRPKS